MEAPVHGKLTSAPPKVGIGDRRVGDAHEVFDVELDEEGKGKLPLVPWTECTVEIYDQRGVQLWAAGVALEPKARKALLDNPPKPTDADMLEEVTGPSSSTLRIPETEPRTLVVLDTGRAPLANVELGQRVRGHFALVGKTDEKGVVKTHLPRRYADHWDRIFKLRGTARLVARKDGHPEIPAEAAQHTGKRAPNLLGTRTARQLVLPPEAATTGRVMVGPETPLANADLILQVRGMGQTPWPILLRTDENGKFEIRERYKTAWVLVAVLDDETRRRLTRDKDYPVARLAILSAHGGRAPSGVFDLSKSDRVELEVTRASGGPAKFARIDGFKFGGFNLIPPLVQVRTDRRGRLTLLTPTCRSTVLIAHGESGFASRVWDGLEGRIELELGGMHEVTGFVKGKDGRPVEAAAVAVGPQLMGSLNQFGQNLGIPNLIMGLQMRHHFKARSDQAGRFSLWVPESLQNVELVVSQNGQQVSSVDVSLGGASQRGVEIEIQ